jgi:hypothetical protein
VLAPSAARATVLNELSTGELARRAHVVARARVVAQRAVLDAGRVWTESELVVMAAHKGTTRAGSRLHVRQPGGRLGQLAMHVAGAARFGVGEEVVLFAEWTGKSYIPVGMCQGKFEIYRDRAGVARVRRDLSQAAFARFDASGRMSIAHARQPQDGRVLAALLAEVRAALRTQGGAR